MTEKQTFHPQITLVTKKGVERIRPCTPTDWSLAKRQASILAVTGTVVIYVDDPSVIDTPIGTQLREGTFRITLTDLTGCPEYTPSKIISYANSALRVEANMPDTVNIDLPTRVFSQTSPELTAQYV